MTEKTDDISETHLREERYTRWVWEASDCEEVPNLKNDFDTNEITGRRCARSKMKLKKKPFHML